MINVYCLSKRFGCSLTDTDECNASVSVCDVNADCKNTVGWYRCSCRAGFSGDGHTCKGEKKFYQKKYSPHKAMSEHSSTITSLNLKLSLVNNLFLI